ncbi:hypothetical protein PILCRDRAFT_14879 [Piloderma croceum F 1598]|uniref:Uncharacterized protein n=1 Tax=Piloderma croceum (strain F 1598) TaxID=765440 RepID=A0A0C3F152_PILCF|nr:hypothetical protein PILCRDRAFT_14879 [Piloderma croceum F 1598]
MTHLKPSGTLHSPDTQGISQINSQAPLQVHECPAGQDDSAQQQYGDSIYNLNNVLDNSHGFKSNNRSNTNSNSGGSTALYHHSGSHYGLGLGGWCQWCAWP